LRLGDSVALSIYTSMSKRSGGKRAETMRCPVASCMKNIEPIGLPTGLQEILAMRIHLHRDHGIYRDTLEALELRRDEESVDLKERETIFIDVDRNESWLDSP